VAQRRLTDPSPITQASRAFAHHAVRQNADRDRREWVSSFGGPVGLSQIVNLAHEQTAGAIGRRHGEEENTAVDFRAGIARPESISRIMVGKRARVHYTERYACQARLTTLQAAPLVGKGARRSG